EAKQLLNEVKEDLKHKNISYDAGMEIGVMLETPAAIMISRELAKQVDFCSIGTNDLIQYTFGLNRQKTIARKFYEECYPTLVQMLRTAISNVHSEGKKVGICGELGADLSWTETFVDMGMDSLSMAPNSILSVREKVIKAE
ncbi:MAG: phosphoenolpyruvate--protein phosphotransferase, partial [Lachnospiraceae bacterium]|nr:phosphoenolpyruvate--protein phosphotransferase [Lachnospiraceae bacterium]